MKLYILITILVCTVTGFGQAINNKTTENKAIVYIYGRDAPSVIGHLRPMVYMDEKEIAKISQLKYFIVIVDPGKHSFHFKKGKEASGFEGDFESGKTYYFRVGWKVSWSVKPDGLEPVAAGVWQFDVKGLKPVDEDNIKNKQIAFTKLPD